MLKKFAERYLFRKAGRRQLVGGIVAVLAMLGISARNPELVKFIKEQGPELIGTIVAAVVAIVAAVDADSLADSIATEEKDTP